MEHGLKQRAGLDPQFFIRFPLYVDLAGIRHRTYGPDFVMSRDSTVLQWVTQCCWSSDGPSPLITVHDRTHMYVFYFVYRILIRFGHDSSVRLFGSFNNHSQFVPGGQR